MTFVVDWALDPTPSLTVVTEEVMEDVQPMLGPGSVCVTATGAVVVSEPRADRLRWTEPDGRSFLIRGVPGLVDGKPWEARFRHPFGVAAAPDGSVVVADRVSNTVRRVDTDGTVTTLAGGPYGQGDLQVGEVTLRWPTSLGLAGAGTLYITDAASNVVRRVSRGGTSTVFACEPAWRPVALSLFADGRVLVAEAQWAPGRTTGRLRTIDP